MTTENTSQSADLHEETRTIWNQNATFWDDKMRDGNDFQRILVGPASERLLNLQPGENVLEIACGNGVFARSIARLGVSIVATDFSAHLLERARARTIEHANSIEYRLVDATNEDEIVALGKQRFDAAVCNMAIMDMSEIDPLMRGIRQVLKPNGRFVFSLMHPCFNTMGTSLCVEETDNNGDLITTYSIKTARYLHIPHQKGVGIIGQPTPHYYFHRPLHVLFNACFRAGLVVDGMEEPAFNSPDDGSKTGRLLSWINYKEIPPVLAVRLRII
ncbi:MAG: class I SAM-dependent methyltransferase [Ktedonobacteraceae bacterium]|nr:class I SAM-dependent methyltransferase [Ktedonobacteraceae bacterium]